MIPVYSSKQACALDAQVTELHKIPSLLLMENVATEIVREINELTDGNAVATIILCGTGNNGGDGLAIARKLLEQGYKTSIVVINPQQKVLVPNAELNFNILKSMVDTGNYDGVFITIEECKEQLQTYEIIIDAVFGIGFRGELHSSIESLFHAVNATNALKVAVDIPSGINTDTGVGKGYFKADYTFTVAGVKPGLMLQNGVDAAGEIVVVPLEASNGISKNVQTSGFISDEWYAQLHIPQRQKNSHKYSNGRLAIIAGSSHYPGAPILTAIAAIKSGCGAPTLYLPKGVHTNGIQEYPELVIKHYGGSKEGILTESSLEEILADLLKADALVLGPGLGRDEQTGKTIQSIISTSTQPIVLDADALFFWDEEVIKNSHPERIIVTPHKGEFSSITGKPIGDIEQNIVESLKTFVEVSQVVTVLKGPTTIVATATEPWCWNVTGNQGLATFGSGDVLAGIVGSFASMKSEGTLKQKVDAAVFVHGAVSEVLSLTQHTNTITASSVAEGITEVITQLLTEDEEN